MTTELLDDDGAVVPTNNAQRRTGTSKSREATPLFTPEPWRARRSIHLATLDDVRTEMARVYRSMANSVIATSEGTKLIFALGQLGKIIEVSELEKRIARLEQFDALPAFTLGEQDDES